MLITMKRISSVAWLNYAAKAALGLLLLHALFFPELSQYQGKGIGWRLLLYPLSGLLVPIVYALSRKRRPYPHLIDLFVILPFLIDTAGNAANFYDTLMWWDDVMHFVTWVPWVVAFGLALQLNRKLSRLNVAMLTVGFGATTHVIWELLEYVAFIKDNPNELSSAYTDTMGDLTFSLCGSIFGALLVSTVLWHVQSTEPVKKRH